MTQVALNKVRTGDYESALEIFEQYHTPKIKSKAATIGVACCLARLRQEKKAREIYDELNSLPDGKRFSPYGLASICVALGEYNKAFEWLDEAFVKRDGSMVKLAVDYRFDSIAKDPRFEALLQKMNLIKH